MVVILVSVLDVIETPEELGTFDETYSPTLPAAALSFVVVPTIPDVVLKVICESVGAVFKTTLPVPVLVVTPVPP
jgi:hypothetical protein